MWSNTSWRSTKYPPLAHIGISSIGVMPSTMLCSPTLMQWNVPGGGTTIMDAPASDRSNRSMISGSGASVSTSA
jgi:hypothetical protein